MTGNTFFEIFIFLDVFAIGVLVAIAFRHGREHYRPASSEPEKPRLPAGDDHLPADIKEQMIQTSQDRFKTVMNRSANLLQHDLETTAEEISALVKRLATEVVSDELGRYRDELNRLQKQAQGDMGQINQAVVAHEAEIKAKIDHELQAEKLRLVKQIDTKLADAVGSFLLETLGHNVDLGSQSTYLLALLEEHKADFIKEVSGESQPRG
jgi:hypothetical protein